LQQGVRELVYFADRINLSCDVVKFAFVREHKMTAANFINNISAKNILQDERKVKTIILGECSRDFSGVVPLEI
jgi:hypothetical protein